MTALVASALPLLWIADARVAEKPSAGSTSGKVGALALVAAGAFLVAPPLLFAGMVLVLAGRPFSVKIRSIQLKRAMASAVPDTLEVIAMAISAGMSIGEMVSLATRCCPPAMRPLFVSADRSLAVGHSRREVLGQLGRAGGMELMPACEILIAADRDGASVALVLDRLATEAGRARRLAADERARRAPVLMLAPLTLCSLPAVFIGTLVPFALLSLGQTRL